MIALGHSYHMSMISILDTPVVKDEKDTRCLTKNRVTSDVIGTDSLECGD